MKKSYIFITAFIAFLAFMPLAKSHAQVQEIVSEKEIINFCVVKYNSQREVKDCACMLAKYAEAQQQMVGTSRRMPEIGNVFEEIKYDCHNYEPQFFEEYQACVKSPRTPRVNDKDEYCACFAQNLEKIEVAFAQQDIDPEAKKHIQKEMQSTVSKNCLKEMQEQ